MRVAESLTGTRHHDDPDGEFGGTVAGAHADTARDGAARNGLPITASALGRRLLAETGRPLYAPNTSNPALRPAVPDEPDSAAVLDLPRGAWIGDPAPRRDR